MLPILLKDLFFFILWLMARVLPIFLCVAYFVCGSIHDVEIAKLVAGGLMVVALTGCWFAMALIFTSAVPALLWRYTPRLLLRSIRIDGDDYKQIRLFGIWFFIGHDSSYEAPMTSLWLWNEEFRYRAFRFEEQTFFEFINAHRNVRPSASSNHELYVKGEKV